MKDFKFSWKRTVAAVIMLAISVLLGIAMDGTFTGEQSPMWQRLVFIAVVIGSGVAALLIAFFGLKGALWGYISIAILGVVNILPKVLPEPWNRYYAIVYFVVLFVWIGFANKLKSSKKTQKEATEPVPEEDAEINTDSLVRGSILAYDPTSGYSWQILQAGGQLRFYRVGNPLKGIDPSRLLREGQPLRAAEKKDIFCPLEDVRSVRYLEQQHGGMIRVKLPGKTVRLVPFEKEGALLNFFRSWLDEEQMRQLKEDENALPGWVTPVYIGVCVLSAAVYLPWLFLHVPYMPFAVLALVLWAAPYVLYGVFPDYFVFLEKTRNSQKKSLVLPSILEGCAMTLRSLTDYPNILQWGKFSIAAGIFIAVLVIAVMLFTSQWRTKKSTLAVIAMAVLFSAFGVVGQLNCTFDPYPPQTQSAVITEMRTSTDDDDITYYIEAQLQDGTEWELEVSKDRYAAVQEGTTVEVDVYSGLLGITYGFVQ